MSEKRFNETERNCYYTSLVFDNHTQEKLGTTKVVDLLNELAEENNILNKNEDNLKECTIENIKLKETNRQLREINKDLGDDLHNCRLNKNIISEKLKLWQDTLVEYDIYTIKDFKELMKTFIEVDKVIDDE